MFCFSFILVIHLHPSGEAKNLEIIVVSELQLCYV